MVNESFYIRRAGPTDAGLLSEMSAVTFSDTFTGTCTDDDMRSFIEEYFSHEKVEKELQDKDDFYFIGFLNDTPVGYIRMKEGKSDVAVLSDKRAIELQRIYVLKEFQSKKIGAALMKFVMDFATENDYEGVWLGVWEHNGKAREFYKKFEFADSGQKHPFPIGNTPQTDIWLYRLIEKK